MLSQYLCDRFPPTLPAIARDEPSTICDAIRVHAALDPQRPAIVCTEFPPLTFGDKQVPAPHTCVKTFSGVIVNELRGYSPAEIPDVECDSTLR